MLQLLEQICTYSDSCNPTTSNNLLVANWNHHVVGIGGNKERKHINQICPLFSNFVLGTSAMFLVILMLYSQAIGSILAAVVSPGFVLSHLQTFFIINISDS